MPKQSQVIQLSDEEYIQLHQYVREGKKSSRAITRARVLLLADEHGRRQPIVRNGPRLPGYAWGPIR